MSNYNDKQPILSRLLSRFMESFVTVFTIHRPHPQNGAFSGVSEDHLLRCLDYATKKNYRFASIDQLVDDALNNNMLAQPTICFTLDDGYADQATRLVPPLIDYKASPTLFVITDFIDQKTWPWDAKLTYLLWNIPRVSHTVRVGNENLTLDLSSKEKRIAARRSLIKKVKWLSPEQLSECIDSIEAIYQPNNVTLIPDEFAPATWQQLRELELKGVRIGSHTKSHMVFNSATDAVIENELQQSFFRLKTELSSPSSVFCYPLGSQQDFSSHHIQLVKNAGYRAAVSTISNITNMTEIRKHPFQIQRIGFPNSFETFVRYTSWREAIRSKLPF